jgi:hypothetical protein
MSAIDPLDDGFERPCQRSDEYVQPPPRRRAPMHFDEPDKSCFAGYGCTDDCPVSVAHRKRRQPLPRARIRAPWFARAGAQSRLIGRIVLGLVACCVVAFLTSLTVQLLLRMAEGAADSRPAKDIARVIANDVLSHVQTYLKETQ